MPLARRMEEAATGSAGFNYGSPKWENVVPPLLSEPGDSSLITGTAPNSNGFVLVRDGLGLTGILDSGVNYLQTLSVDWLAKTVSQGTPLALGNTTDALAKSWPYFNLTDASMQEGSGRVVVLPGSNIVVAAGLDASNFPQIQAVEVTGPSSAGLRLGGNTTLSAQALSSILMSPLDSTRVLILEYGTGFVQLRICTVDLVALSFTIGSIFSLPTSTGNNYTITPPCVLSSTKAILYYRTYDGTTYNTAYYGVSIGTGTTISAVGSATAGSTNFYAVGLVPFTTSRALEVRQDTGISGTQYYRWIDISGTTLTIQAQLTGSDYISNLAGQATKVMSGGVSAICWVAAPSEIGSLTATSKSMRFYVAKASGTSVTVSKSIFPIWDNYGAFPNGVSIKHQLWVNPAQLAQGIVLASIGGVLYFRFIAATDTQIAEEHVGGTSGTYYAPADGTAYFEEIGGGGTGEGATSGTGSAGGTAAHSGKLRAVTNGQSFAWVAGAAGANSSIDGMVANKGGNVTPSAIRAAAGSSSTSATTLTPAIPTGVAAGDVMVALVALVGTGKTISTPVGWTKQGSQQTVTGIGAAAVYTRVWQSGDSAPSFTWSGATGCIAFIEAYSGLDTSSPFASIDVQTNAASTTIAIPNTTAGDSSGAWMYLGIGVGVKVITKPASWNDVTNGSQNAGTVLYGRGSYILRDGVQNYGSGTTMALAASSVSIGWRLTLNPLNDPGRGGIASGGDYNISGGNGGIDYVGGLKGGVAITGKPSAGDLPYLGVGSNGDSSSPYALPLAGKLRIGFTT